MYEFARGPLLWATTIVFVAGMVYRIVQLVRLTEKKPAVLAAPRGVRTASPEERKFRAVLAFQHTFLGQHPVMAILSLLIHIGLIATPFFVFAHNELLRQSWGFSLLSLPDGLIDVLTVLVLVGMVFYLVRRLAIPRVRLVSSLEDYVVLLVTAAPFLTGVLAYHQWGDYRTMVTLHVLAGELMLVSIPFTKLGHMVFFFFARGFFGSEFSLWRGSREWSA